LTARPEKDDGRAIRRILSMSAEESLKKIRQTWWGPRDTNNASQRLQWRLRPAASLVPDLGRVISYARGESHLSSGDLCSPVRVDIAMARQPSMYWVSQHALWQ
jgi:hypothetical protein